MRKRHDSPAPRRPRKPRRELPNTNPWLYRYVIIAALLLMGFSVYNFMTYWSYASGWRNSTFEMAKLAREYGAPLSEIFARIDWSGFALPAWTLCCAVLSVIAVIALRKKKIHAVTFVMSFLLLLWGFSLPLSPLGVIPGLVVLLPLLALVVLSALISMPKRLPPPEERPPEPPREEIPPEKPRVEERPEPQPVPLDRKEPEPEELRRR